MAIPGKPSGGIAREIRNPLGVIDNSARCVEPIHKDADGEDRMHLDINIKTG